MILTNEIEIISFWWQLRLLISWILLLLNPPPKAPHSFLYWYQKHINFSQLYFGKCLEIERINRRKFSLIGKIMAVVFLNLRSGVTTWWKCQTRIFHGKGRTIEASIFLRKTFLFLKKKEIPPVFKVLKFWG